LRAEVGAKAAETFEALVGKKQELVFRPLLAARSVNEASEKLKQLGGTFLDLHIHGIYTLLVDGFRGDHARLESCFLRLSKESTPLLNADLEATFGRADAVGFAVACGNLDRALGRIRASSESALLLARAADVRAFEGQLITSLLARETVLFYLCHRDAGASEIASVYLMFHSGFAQLACATAERIAPRQNRKPAVGEIPDRAHSEDEALGEAGVTDLREALTREAGHGED